MNCKDCCYDLPKDGHSYCTYEDGECVKISMLEKENAELNGKLLEQKQYTEFKCNEAVKKKEIYEREHFLLTKAKELIKELSKSLFLAKGIIRDLIDDTVDFKESKERATYCYEQEKFDTYKKAEQFLKDCEVKND